MKIAVASEGQLVSRHFGHCEGFNIFEVEEKQVLKKEYVQNPGHKPGFLPNFLKDLGVKVVISGCMGEKAQQLLAQGNIEVIVGAEGDCEAVVQDYLKGELKSTKRICGGHHHAGRCHKHK